MITSKVTVQPIDESEGRKLVSAHDGALVVFLGVVREQNDGFKVTGLEYEAYENMAERQMDDIGHEAGDRWDLTSIAMIHRVGKLAVGESSVLVAVSSPHREQAFAACKYCIDTLKQRVSVWKKEFRASGQSDWVSGASSS